MTVLTLTRRCITIAVCVALDDDTSADWTLRHGRCVALGIAIMQDAKSLVTSEYGDRVEKASLSFSQSDRVRCCVIFNRFMRAA